MNKPNLIFITGNINKYYEVQNELKQYCTLTMHNIDLPEIQGTDDEIIKCKAEYTKEFCKTIPFIVEDTSLEFEALGGMPGPYIKWFLKNTTAEGLVKMLQGFDNKNAKAICNIAYSDGVDIQYIKGVCCGCIVPEKGISKFGWDNIFKPDGFEKTFGEMDCFQKNRISHRGEAVQSLIKILSEK
jgi:inosine triphosphate pyrophosphatase